jgi:hypothetical protein
LTDHEEHPSEYLPELALGVLPTAEAAAVQGHVASCEICRNELDEMTRVARLLPLAVEDIEPESTMKDAVFARIAGEQKVIPIAATRRASAGRVSWVGAIAASIIGFLAIGGVGGFLLRGDGNNDALERNVALQTSILDSAGRGDLKLSRGQSGEQRVALLRAPGSNEAYAWVDGMPPLPAGKAYQAWFTKDGKSFEPSSVFTTSEGGTILPAAGNIDGYAAMGLTIEDAGGASTPTQAPFMTLDLSKSVQVIR